MGRVRVVRALRPFPDEDHAVLKDVGAVVYGLCEVSAWRSDIAAANQRKNEDHMELRAYYYNRNAGLLGQADKTGRSFLSPWPNIRGIGVDRRYLWVFRVGEIACATHTSIKACLDNNQAEPSWNTYTIPRRPFDKNDKEKHVYDGLLDLAPCDDGTLTAAVGFRSGKLYEMRPRIDRKAKTLVIDRWRPLDKELFKDPRGAGWAMRVHKQPVVGYTLLEGLMEALEKASTTLTIEQESVLGGKNAHGTIALSMPAAEDIAVTFTITSYHKEIFRVPDPITITKGTQFHPVSIKTKKTAEDVVALITATALSPSQPFELTAQLWAIAPS